jgi:hypothetical protein
MITGIEQQTIERPRSLDQNGKRADPRLDVKAAPQGESPYTAKNLDSAIAHLEVVIAVDDNNAVFGRRYWLGRVQQVALTPGIMPTQSRRLQSLLDQLKDAA